MQYTTKGYHPNKIIKRKAKNGYRHLANGQIKEAMVALFWKLDGGEKIKPLHWASKIYELAQGLDGKAYDDDERLVNDTKKEIEKRDASIAQFQKAMVEKAKEAEGYLAAKRKNHWLYNIIYGALLAGIAIYEFIERVLPLWNG